MLARYKETESDKLGYAHIQGTRPQTISYGLADSPVGLCAWITEKFRAWSDNRGDLRDAFSWDDLLGNGSIHWFTSSIGSSVRLYRELYDSLERGSFLKLLFVSHLAPPFSGQDRPRPESLD